MKAFLNSLYSRKLLFAIATNVGIWLAKLPEATKTRYAAAVTIAYMLVNVIESVLGGGNEPPVPPVA